MDTVIVLAKFEVRILPVPEIIAIGVLGGVRGVYPYLPMAPMRHGQFWGGIYFY